MPGEPAIRSQTLRGQRRQYPQMRGALQGSTRHDTPCYEATNRMPQEGYIEDSGRNPANTTMRSLWVGDYLTLHAQGSGRKALEDGQHR
jgi:hypothetical protein